MLCLELRGEVVSHNLLFSTKATLGAENVFREKIGYGSRVKNSIFGVIFGFIMCLGAIVLLVWNERDAVRQKGAISEINKVAVADVPSDRVDEAMDGMLVHMNATAVTEDVLEYETFGVRENAIRLRWETSIFQWKEKKTRTDDETRYSYSKQWVDEPIDSSRFRRPGGHSNDGSQKHFQDGSRVAANVAFGAFQLSSKLVGQIDKEQPLSLPESVTMDVRPQGFVSGGVFQTGEPNSPQIGDERVEVFKTGPKHEATIMARQSGSTFASYETRIGISKEILYLGKLTKPEVIDRQLTEAAIKRWLLRGLGFVLSWIGFSLTLKPIRAVLSFIPFVGKLLDGAIMVVGFLLAAIVTSVVIAVAWFVVRPILSGVLIVVALITLYLLYRQKSESPAGEDTGNFAPPPTPPPLPTN